MVLIFLESVKITSVDLKLDRPQLQHWSLFLEHNRPRSKDLNVVGLHRYLWAVTVFMVQLASPAILSILIDAGPSSSFGRI